MISGFFISLVKVSRSLSHFGIFIANEEEGVSQLSLSLTILQKKKIEQSNAQMRTPKALLCYVYTTMLNLTPIRWYTFISHVWEVNKCTIWFKAVVWNRSETVWDFIKTLWRKTAKTKETGRCLKVYKMPTRRRLVSIMRALMIIYKLSVEVFQKYHRMHSLFCFVRTRFISFWHIYYLC